MRVLGAVRQSKTKDRAVSPEVQRAKINGWSVASGHQVVKITEDLSRSGKISAFQRPELGPWLTDETKIACWDILVTTKLDRACRNTADYLRLREWCKQHRKRLVLLNNPELDESTAAGKAMGGIQAVFAEFERDMASERRLETMAELQEQGRWDGRRLPYGRRAEKRDAGYYVVMDDQAAAVLCEMSRQIIAGRSYVAAARWANSNGYLTQLGHLWRPEALRSVLGRDVAQSLVEDPLALRAAMRGREQSHGQHDGHHMLLRVAYCARCDKPLYGNMRRKSGRHYYRCVECNKLNYPMGKLEAAAEDLLLQVAGSRKLTRVEVIPGDDHAQEIKSLKDEQDRVKGTRFYDAGRYDDEIARLEALPYEPDRIERVSTGKTVAQYWAALESSEDKGDFLRKWGAKVFVYKREVEGGKPQYRLELVGGWLDIDSDSLPYEELTGQT